MEQSSGNFSELINRAQKDDSRAVENIIVKMLPKIKKSISSIPLQDREDVEQEIKIKLIAAIKSYNTHTVPGFWNFINSSLAK